MTEITPEAQKILDSVNVAVGKLLTELYRGSPDYGDGRLEAEIVSYVRRWLGKDIVIGEFTRYYDPETGYTIHLDVRLPVDNSEEIMIELSKVVIPRPDEFDRPDIIVIRPDVDGAPDA